jgi:hypothetical protein
MNTSAKCLRAQPAMNRPLLIPDSSQRSISHAGDEVEDIRRAEGDKAGLLPEI